MGPFVFLDIETTGFDPSRDHIIEIACIKWADGKILGRFESLINPGAPIPQEISLLTGIKDNDIKSAPKFLEIKEKVFEFIGDLPVVGHNIPFDNSFLKYHHVEFKNPEIDTLELARILLFKEPSYALEVMMKKYCGSAKKSHRAMADTENTLAFFEFLLGLIAEIPAETLEKIQTVFGKTEWHGRNVFEKAAAAARGTRKKNTKNALKNIEKNAISSAKSALPPRQWTKDIIKDFLAGNKILLQSPFKIPLSELKDQRLVIAYSSFRKRNELLKKAGAEDLSIINIKEPYFYLSPKKLKIKLQQKSFSAEETPFLLKMILWSNETLTGDREELSLERKEYSFFETCADTERNDVFWKKILKNADETKIILIHHAAIAKDILKNLNMENRGLIILESSNLEDNFTFALREKITQNTLHPYFGEKAAIISGLIGIFYEHCADLNAAGFSTNVILDDRKRNLIQWKRVIEAINNLPDHPKKMELLAALAPKENCIQWISLFADEIIFASAPVFIADIFRENTAGFDKIILQSDVLSGDGGFSLVRELLELDSSWKELIEEQNPWFGNLKIEVAKNMPDPNTEGHFRTCVKLFMKIIEEKRGKSLFILNSKKTIESVYQSLINKTQELDVNLFAVGPSGGVGKSLALFLNNPDSSVLLATNQILAFFDEIEPHLDTVIFQKIPFDSPDNPIVSARAQQFTNGFTQYTLQRALIKFREILIEFGRSEREKTCYILDNRLLSRDYGKMFIE